MMKQKIDKEWKDFYDSLELEVDIMIDEEREELIKTFDKNAFKLDSSDITL